MEKSEEKQVMTLHCMRCGHESREEIVPSVEPKERACPRCKSNSIRKLKRRESEE